MREYRGRWPARLKVESLRQHSKAGDHQPHNGGFSSVLAFVPSGEPVTFYSRADLPCVLALPCSFLHASSLGVPKLHPSMERFRLTWTIRASRCKRTRPPPPGGLSSPARKLKGELLPGNSHRRRG
jgi:hypothetical protein